MRTSYIQSDMQTCTYAYGSRHACMQSVMHARTQTCMLAFSHTEWHKYMQTYRPACIQTSSQTGRRSTGPLTDHSADRPIGRPSVRTTGMHVWAVWMLGRWMEKGKGGGLAGGLAAGLVYKCSTEIKRRTASSRQMSPLLVGSCSRSAVACTCGTCLVDEWQRAVRGAVRGGAECRERGRVCACI